MAEYADLLLNGVFCEACGEFINAEPVGHPQKCQSCHEDELVNAVESDIWPDGMTFEDWQEVKRKYTQK